MEPKVKRKSLIALLISQITISIASLVNISYAGFAAGDRLDQHAGYQGQLPVSIYLNANIWDTTGAEFYMHVWKDNGAGVWIAPNKQINPTINDVNFKLYVFRYDAVNYNKLLFARVNPEGLTKENINDKIWNQTYNIAYDSANNVNYYCIEQWHKDDNDSNPSVCESNSLSSSPVWSFANGASKYIINSNQ